MRCERLWNRIAEEYTADRRLCLLCICGLTFAGVAVGVVRCNHIIGARQRDPELLTAPC